MLRSSPCEGEALRITAVAMHDMRPGRGLAGGIHGKPTRQAYEKRGNGPYMAGYEGLSFGNYQVLGLLGKGGFAEVYLGEHIYLKTRAAIKILHTQLGEARTSCACWTLAWRGRFHFS